MRKAAALLLALCFAAPIYAAEVGGVKLDDKVAVGGQELALNGAGVRSRVMFKVYVGSLYLPAKAADLAGVKEMAAGRVTPEMPPPPAPVLARDSVHHVGQLVAAVVAETAAAARDGVDRLRIEYEPRPAVVDPEAALAEDAPLAFPALGLFGRAA